MKTEEVARTSAILGNDVICQEFVEARFLKFRSNFRPILRFVSGEHEDTGGGTNLAGF